jgi:ribose transport system substrate-binding protein
MVAVVVPLLALMVSSAAVSGASVAAASSKATLPAGCSSAHPLVGVALPNTVNPYYIAMRQSFLTNGTKDGFTVKVAIADDSDSIQLSQIDAFIQQHVCAVVLNAVDSGPGATMVSTLDKAGIPVITVNVIVSQATLNAEHASDLEYVGPNQVQGGEIIGRMVLNALGGKSKIVAGIVGDPEQVPTNERDQGFKETLSTDPNAKVVATVNGLVEPSVSLTVATDMMEGNPSMNVIFADTGPAAVGTIEAIKGLHKVGKVSLFAFCAASTKLDKTVYRGCVAQQPVTYAQIALQNMKTYLAGKTIPKLIQLKVASYMPGQTPPYGEVG